MTAIGSPPSWSWDHVLDGVVPPLVSPLRAGVSVDEAALHLLIEHVLRAGCTGLFVLGGSGEGPWLTQSQRGAMIRTARQAAAGRAPVLAGLMLPGTGPALDAARQAVDEGADALVAGSPYYYALDAAAQRRHIEAVLETTPLPVLLYNIPTSTHHPLAPDAVAALAATGRVLGIKDSGADVVAFEQYLAVKRSFPRFRVLAGNQPLFVACLLLGADGLVPGLANVAPDLFVSQLAAAKRGDVESVRALQSHVDALLPLHKQGYSLAGLKAAVSSLGIGDASVARPLVPLTDTERRAVEDIVRRAGLTLTPKPPTVPQPRAARV